VGVSVRTVFRDIDHLSAAGVPVVAERGAAGGFELLDGWRTQLTGFTSDEAQALLLAGLRGPAAQLGIGEAMASAQLKLLAALPAAAQADASRVGSRFHLDPVGWYQTPTRADHLPAIARSVWNDQRLRIRYGSWKAVVDREVEPLGLVLKAGEWYLVARVAGDCRTYRVASVISLEALPDRFVRPKKFNLERHWIASIERFEAELYRRSAVVRVTPSGLARLRTLSAAVCQAIDRAATKSEGARRVRVTIPIESIEQAAVDLLKLGAEGEVLEPAELRRRIGRTSRDMARRYSRTNRKQVAR
jgi:predicted DNA-binding transcriptional regulator YafY